MTFANCTEAYAAGVANIKVGNPAYALKLDRDHDGVGCEQPPAGFHARHSAGTKVESGASVGTQLPQTGPAGEIGVLGGLMLLVGVVSVALVRRRRVRFTS